MKTDLLFQSCPFITSANITLSRIGIADCDALWEIMRDDELFRFEPDAPAELAAQAEARIEQAEALFQQKKSVTLGAYANTDLSHLIGWIEIGGVNQDLNELSLRFMFGRRCVGTEFPAESIGALCRYLFEMMRVNRVQSSCLAEDYDKQRILEKSGFVREGVLRECHKWNRQGIISLAFYAMLASDYNFLKNIRTVAVDGETLLSQE